ncbi:MAG: PAS domain-containing protein, partial [Planctomycetota bacterium]
MQDILAAHKQVERTLWCLAKIAEQAQEGIAVIDLAGTIGFVNSKWAKMHGYDDPRELVGQQFSVFHTQQQMKTDVIPFIVETERRGQLAGPVEHVRKDGSTFPTEMKMTLARGQEGKAIGFMCFALDITERKGVENQWQELHTELESRIEQQAAEVTAANEQLRRQACEREQAEKQWREYQSELERRLEQQAGELKAANEKLQGEIGGREQAEKQWQEHRGQLEQCIELQEAELAAVKQTLQQQTKEREQSEHQLQEYGDKIEQQRAKLAATDQKLQEELSKQSLSEEQLAAANERLQQQISEHEQVEKQWETQQKELEQQAGELATTKEQLRQEINKGKQTDEVSTAAKEE